MKTKSWVRALWRDFVIGVINNDCGASPSAGSAAAMESPLLFVGALTDSLHAHWRLAAGDANVFLTEGRESSSVFLPGGAVID